MPEDSQTGNQVSFSSEVINQLRNNQLLVVNPRRRNGLILYKQYHAEFAGPGAVVGSLFDLDAVQVLPVGNLSLITAEGPEERQRSYKLRRQWVIFLQQISRNTVPLERSQIILNQFKHYFNEEIINKLPNEAFALLVGVLPQTIKQARKESME